MLFLLFFIFGIMIGSFLNVVILRLPGGGDIVYKSSGCPQCGTPLRWYHNIPLISFVFLRGKCAFCGKKISWQYPLVEFITGLIALILMPSDFNHEAIFLFLFYFTVACVFLCHFIIDFRHQLLLDSLNLYLLANFLLFSFFFHSYQYWLIGGAIGFIFPLAVTWIFYKLRGQVGLGGGDIKLFGVLGVFLGPAGIVMNIFLSCLLGAVLGMIFILSGKMKRDRPMAFGPFILIVAVFQIFFSGYAREVQRLFLGY